MTAVPTYFTIMHTTCHRAWGGLERRIFNESRWMAAKGHHIVIAAPPDTPLSLRAQQRAEEEGDRRWQYIPIQFTGRSMVHDFFKLIRCFKSIQPDILNTHGNTDAKVALSAAAAFSMVHKKEAIPCKILSRHISAHVKPTWYNRQLYGNLCDRIFTTAAYTSRHLAKTLHLNKEKVLTLPSGITPPNDLPDRASARQNLAADLGLPQDVRFVGFVGRVSPDKGVGIIVQAFLKTMEQFPHHHLVIVGSGEADYLASLKKNPQSTKKNGQCSPRIHFVGFNENVWPYLTAFDCHILASATQFEGISQALLEAMFARCPVIASNTGGTPEIITHGKTGLLFPPNDAAALSHGLMQLISDPDLAKQMTLAAFSQVNTLHTIDAMGHRILDIYSRCLDKCSSRNVRS